MVVPRTDPGDDTRILTGAALAGLRGMLEPGHRYKKAGRMLTALPDRAARQTSIFDEAQQQRSARLIATMDAVNRDFGRNALRLASAGIGHRRTMRSGRRPPPYTTSRNELPVVR